MFDPFPGWSAPWVLAGLVALRLACNLGLTALVAAASPRRLDAMLAGAATALSTLLTVLVLRGVLGILASYAELLVQLLLVVATGALVYRHHPDRTVLAGFLLLCATGLGLVMVPIYGEATVAP